MKKTDKIPLPQRTRDLFDWRRESENIKSMVEWMVLVAWKKIKRETGLRGWEGGRSL